MLYPLQGPSHVAADLLPVRPERLQIGLPGFMALLEGGLLDGQQRDGACSVNEMSDKF